MSRNYVVLGMERKLDEHGNHFFAVEERHHVCAASAKEARHKVRCKAGRRKYVRRFTHEK